MNRRLKRKTTPGSSSAGVGARPGLEPAWASYGPTDVPYLRTFFRRLAPAWLDHVALLRGFAPPARKRGLTWCELGCGQGVTPVFLAATHPDGRFFGIDAMAAHIHHARQLAREAGIQNAVFHEADFAAARGLDLPKLDYIVAHGVYSWIDSDSQEALRRIIDERLARGGLVYVSYNALPGWAQDLALRQVLFEFGRSLKGDGVTRVTAAARTVAALVGAQAPALRGSRAKALAEFDRHYLAHEYLGSSWRPLYVTELRAAMAKIGLVPVGSAQLVQNYDSFVLGQAARKALEGIDDDDLRELARDVLLDNGFRSDVFTRGARRLDETERICRLNESSFMLAKPAAAIAFDAATPGGTLKFDNDASRRIIAELAGGPRRLTSIRRGSVSRRDLLANALTLCAAEALWPVEPRGAPARGLVEAIYDRLGGPAELLFLPLPSGTAVAAEPGLLRRLRDGLSLDDYPGWRDFLAAHGFGASAAETGKANVGKR